MQRVSDRSGLPAGVKVEPVWVWYQNASIQVSIVQVHPYPDDPYVGPRPLDAARGVVAARRRPAVGLYGGGWSQRGGGGLVGGRGRVHVKAGDGRRPHVLQQEERPFLRRRSFERRDFSDESRL